MDDSSPRFLRRSTIIDLGSTDRRLQRSVSAGDLVRVVPGTYLATADWSRLDAMGRHRARVLATAERLRAGLVFSHRAAAAIWGIRMLSDWPAVVDVTVERSTGGRSTGGIRRHCRGFDGVEVVEHDGMLVTSPAQTVVDLARQLGFADAVACADSALHRRREGGALTLRGDVLERVAAAEGRRGVTRALRAAEFSTELSDSVEESHSRVQIHALGFPAPVLQQSFSDEDGHIGDVDFAWPEFSHVGEFDGRAKYLDRELRGGRTEAQVVLAEKHRENRLRRLVRTLSRWETAELYPPTGLFRILSGAGLPSGPPRRVVA